MIKIEQITAGYGESLNDALTDFLENVELTREQLIDVKYQVTGDEDPYESVLVIYED